MVTLVVDERARTAWNSRRRRWFPPERLLVDAHLTLFHALPGERAATVLADCAEIARATAPFELTVTGPRSLGRGVALDVRSPELARLHADLRARWESCLTRQDAQPFKPHVTLQNKVSAEVAAETLTAVRADPGPVVAKAAGVRMWWYRGGPWEPVATELFAG